MHSLDFVRKELQLNAQLGLKEGSAAECVDQNCFFCKELNKSSSVDVAPTLGVKHVKSCVVLFCAVMFFMLLISR